MTAPSSRRPGRSRRAAATGAPIGVLIGLSVLAAAFALLIGVDNPTGLLVAVPCTAVSMGVVLAGFFWLDRWEPEPSRLLLLAFLWGATVAVVVSLVLELASSEVLGRGVVLVVAAPLIEEAAKGAFLLLMLTGARRREFDGVVDGIVYAGFTAVGFAFIEDIGYIAQSFGEGTDVGAATIVLRLVMAPFAHPLFTAMTGIGIGIAVSRPRGTVTWAAPLAGFALAVGLHALWNASVTFGLAGYLLVYFLVMVPIFVFAVFWARSQRRRERDIIARQLPAMVYYHWLTPMEAGWLASIAARRAWRKAVAARSGRGAARLLTDFQTTATELAFLRDRSERGVAPAGAYYLHAELVERLARDRAAAQAPLYRQPAVAPPLAPMAPRQVGAR
ncbi:MAG: PrsW family intrarane metalloprotease [Frankiales bacterium]|nr:PrsW family intrarane metalloprotease [Frankiales bacterium]